MARKPRKRAYIPPENEVVNRRDPAERKPRTRQQPRGGRGSYVPPAPSWGRTFRRLPVYFVVLTALQYLLPSKSTDGMSDSERLVQAIIFAGVLTLMFSPFIYWMERFAYRRYMKQNGLDNTAEKAPPSEDTPAGDSDA